MARASLNPACDGLGPGAVDTTSSFTIGAINTTLPNANNTGAPIVVVIAGAYNVIDAYQLGTWAQYKYPLMYPNIQLLNGTAIVSGNASTARPAQAGRVFAGSPPEWAVRVNGSLVPADGAQIYCAVYPPGNQGPPVLAVNGDTDSFSLCQSAFSENVVYYKAAPNHNYDFDSCYPVKLQLNFD
ncbi:hypothetical protein PYCCODRAFT_1371322 [Trametes coccinea BRFM310]|uniref:Uncharacterized protein n=1 Tax=Trametes coccinea (strain BRFM310) TaxID=1353009 RepID=A0A1Y2IIF2_TRAC3|nr:hypothetical protein PYCCODRAFT_1371322 [Trametes coccinea BRFM310]